MAALVGIIGVVTDLDGNQPIYLTALENETAVVKSFFDYLKRRHLVVRGGAAPPAPPRRCAEPWPLPRQLFSYPN